MVYRDYWALSQWYARHARLIGAEHLYIVCHGEDPAIARLCPGANLSVWPRDSFDDFDRRRGDMLNALQADLLQRYDWVFRLDADEVLLIDPAYYSSLAAAFRANADVPVLSALAFDLVALEDEPSQGDPFAAHRNAAFSGHYSKAVAEQTALPFQLHGVIVPPDQLANFPHRIPHGLYLAHLKYADRSALDQANAVRADLANAPGRGLPGRGWQQAAIEAQDFLTDFLAKPVWSWKRASDWAHELLTRNPTRLTKPSLVKTQAIKFKMRTKVPDWMCDT